MSRFLIDTTKPINDAKTDEQHFNELISLLDGVDTLLGAWAIHRRVDGLSLGEVAARLVEAGRIADSYSS